MVLWEITLGTAYFLGLKRTYKLALRIQRRLISPKHPKIRQFVHGRIRLVFDVALKVHRNIQQRDLEVGRNLGNWILRWLDKMKPSAQIRTSTVEKPPHGAVSNMKMTRQEIKSSHAKNSWVKTSKSQEFDRHLFTGAKNIWSRPFPNVGMMMRPLNSSGSITQYRQLYTSEPLVTRLNYRRDGLDGVIRKDILQWMQQK